MFHAWVHCWGKWQKTGPKGIQNIPRSCVQCRFVLVFPQLNLDTFPHIIYFVHYVLVLAFDSLDKSAPLVSSDRLAATGFSIADWVILHTAGQMGPLSIIRLVMDRKQNYPKQLRLIRLPWNLECSLCGPLHKLLVLSGHYPRSIFFF